MSSRAELLALVQRIRDRDADMKRRGGKIQRVFRQELPMVIDALHKEADLETGLPEDEHG